MQKVFVDYPVETVEFNPAGERLIVLLHGFGASTFSWRTVTKDLAELGHVIAYDRPGFGGTPLVERTKTNDPYSLAGQVELLRTIIQKNAAGRKVVVIGHSSGALVATEFALMYPNLLNCLILESPAIWRGSPVPSWAAGALRNRGLEGGAERLLEGFAASGMKILRRSFFNSNKLTQEIIDGYTEPMSRGTWKRALWRFMTASQTNKVRNNLWCLELPVFVITGDHDEIVKVEDTFRVAERILCHSIYLVPQTGHLAHEESPEDFLQVTLRFIKKHT